MTKYALTLAAFGLVLTGAGCTMTQEVAMEGDDAMMEDTMEMEMVVLNDGTYTLSDSEEEVRWEASKIVGARHTGTVDASEGSLTVEGGVVTAGKVVVDMTTINDEDLEGAMKEQLETHLKSEDFFAVEANPTATFVISAVEALEGIEGRNFRVDGVMTIRGIEQDISFPAMIDMDGEVVAFEAELNLDRTLWDVNFGSGSLFENLGDAVINDEFMLMLDLDFVVAE